MASTEEEQQPAPSATVVGEQEEEQIPPTTALITLSQNLLFKPEGNVLHMTILVKSALASCLDNHVKPESLESIHLVMRSLDVSTMFDEQAIVAWAPYLQPGGEIAVHFVSTDGAQVSDEDVGTVRMSFVMAELRAGPLGEAPDGSKHLSGTKAGGAVDDDDEEEDS